MSKPDSLFAARAEEAEIELLFRADEIETGNKRCICCPSHHPHVFGYAHRLEAKGGSGYPRTADDLVRDLLHDAFREYGDAATVNEHRVRITVELIAP